MILRRRYRLSAGTHHLPLGERTLLMGIINVTPDSFSQDGLWRGAQDTVVSRAVRLARKMANAGADILDIGGESSRPGAHPITESEELRRTIPVIRAIKAKVDIPISIDSSRPDVVHAALQEGAAIVNDIRGVMPSRKLLRIVRDSQAAIVLMHMRGQPRIMQRRIKYGNLIAEIIAELKNSVEICLESGIKSDKIIIDPGIGFGKTCAHNLEIINRLNEFNCLRQPILIGTSRKSFIGQVLDREVSGRTWGTAASVCLAIANGAHIIRVHDVRQMRDAADITDAIMNCRHKGKRTCSSS